MSTRWKGPSDDAVLLRRRALGLRRELRGGLARRALGGAAHAGLSRHGGGVGQVGAHREPGQSLGGRAGLSELADVLAGRKEPLLHVQPIVDTRRGTVSGYEALSRFDGVRPDVMFELARQEELAVTLDIRVLRAALLLVGELPPRAFLTVNLMPETLASRELGAFLARAGDLSRLILEVTENERIGDYAAVSLNVSALRRAGGRLAVDDAGAGYANLQHILRLRPDLVKLDRELIRDIDRDDTKRVVVEMFGSFTNRIDASLVGEGVETAQELEVLAQLGVPMVQGYFLGKPALPWPTMTDAALVAVAARQSTASVSGTLGELLERRAALASDASASAIAGAFSALPLGRDVVVATDASTRPVGVFRRSADAGEADRHLSPCLIFAIEQRVEDAAQRAMLRPPGSRFDELVCADESGAYAGVVQLQRVVERLAQRA